MLNTRAAKYDFKKLNTDTNEIFTGKALFAPWFLLCLRKTESNYMTEEK